MYVIFQYSEQTDVLYVYNVVSLLLIDIYFIEGSELLFGLYYNRLFVNIGK